MRDESEHKVKFETRVAEMLACPACHRDLRLEGECLVCGGCGRRYPVVDGIPMLIAERAAGD